jgi:hypothetical protein
VFYCSVTSRFSQSCHVRTRYIPEQSKVFYRSVTSRFSQSRHVRTRYIPKQSKVFYRSVTSRLSQSRHVRTRYIPKQSKVFYCSVTSRFSQSRHVRTRYIPEQSKYYIAESRHAPHSRVTWEPRISLNKGKCSIAEFMSVKQHLHRRHTTYTTKTHTFTPVTQVQSACNMHWSVKKFTVYRAACCALCRLHVVSSVYKTSSVKSVSHNYGRIPEISTSS